MSEKLISADKLLFFIKRDADLLASCGEEQIVDDVIAMIKTAPAVDAVEVVRCCRCRFAVNKREHGEMVTYCALDWGMRGVLDPNDYCSYGKEIKRCQD